MSEFYSVFHSSVPEIFIRLETTDMSAMELSKELDMDNSGIQKTLKTLQVKGYVERYLSKCEDSFHRCWKWKLTDKGKATVGPMITLYSVMEGLKCQ